jgi:hypothetical protein
MPIRTAVLAVLAMLVAVLSTAVHAPGADARPKYTVGIADQSVAMLSDPRFRALQVRHSRLVVPYDVMRDKAQLARFAPVLDVARITGVDVLVAFNHSARRPRKLPSAGEYGAAVAAFRARFPWVRTLSPWNEANHSSQPTARRPDRAARYFDIVRKLCAGCQIVAADLVDMGGYVTWVKRFRHAAKGRPRIWGLHNYHDVNHFEDRTTRRFRQIVRGQLWLTETGGMVVFAHHQPYNEKRAARATAHVFRLAARNRVARVYLYQWSGAPKGARWDSGLVSADGRERPALGVVKKVLKYGHP